MDSELHTRFDIPHGRDLFKELVLHIADSLKSDRLFGAAKLNKILWMADFGAFTLTGRPITGVEYRKLQLGPVPSIITEVKNELVRDGHARIVKEDIGMTYPQERLIPLRAVDYTYFRVQDIVIADKIIEQTRHSSGQELIDQSHGIAWQAAETNAPIPYEAAFLSDEPYTIEDIEHTHILAKAHGWN